MYVINHPFGFHQEHCLYSLSMYAEFLLPDKWDFFLRHISEFLQGNCKINMYHDETSKALAL